MARIVLPLFGPSVPVMSSAFGFADGFRLQVPRSGFVPTVTVYWSPLSSSLMVLRTSSGNFFPPSSAADGSQVPSRVSSMASSLQAADEHETTRANATNSLSVICNLLQGTDSADQATPQRSEWVSSSRCPTFPSQCREGGGGPLPA